MACWYRQLFFVSFVAQHGIIAGATFASGAACVHTIQLMSLSGSIPGLALGNNADAGECALAWKQRQSK